MLISATRLFCTAGTSAHAGFDESDAVIVFAPGGPAVIDSTTSGFDVRIVSRLSFV